jgi:hypothetical protein
VSRPPTTTRALGWRRGPLDLLRRASAPAAATAVLGASAACSDREVVRVALEARPTPEYPGRLVVRAQVAGPLAGLTYRWYGVTGSCRPQTGPEPVTEFRFGPGATRDRVLVEVWRDSTWLARNEIIVQLDTGRAKRAVGLPPDLQVRITDVPPYDADGGPETRANIAGRVDGQVPHGFRVVLYARADSWYVQPTPTALHAIGPGGRWASWTHTGSSYAALVVRAGFEPVARLDMLPAVGGDVVARTIVEGRR